MTINRTRLATLTAVLISFSGGTLYAETLPFGVFGFPLDISASVKETLLPSGTEVFNVSPSPLFDTVPGDSVNLLVISPAGVNASGRSKNISGAFVSALTAADGNGGVGVSQLIFGSPDSSGLDSLRQLVAQSLWTQTFRNNGMSPVDITLHLHIPALQVQLLGVAPRRSGPSATESAQAEASVASVITHPDLTQLEGSRFDFGLRETEQQIPSGTDLLNLPKLEVLGQTGTVARTVKFNGDDFNPAYSIDSVFFDLDLGTLHPGDILSYTYTLTAEGTTHGFEHGYDAFLGDPFGVDVVGNNLLVTVAPAGTDAPEASTCALMLLGFAGLLGHVLRFTIPLRWSIRNAQAGDTIKESLYGQPRDSAGRYGANLLGAAKDRRFSAQAARPAGEPATNGPGQRSMAPAGAARLEKPLAFHGFGFDDDAQPAGGLCT